MNKFIKGYEYKISDLFEYIGRGKRNITSSIIGEYNLIGASKFNNGVVM